MLPITTDRLVLRRFTHDDIPFLLDVVSHPSVSRATPEIEPTAAGIREYIDRQNSYQPFEQDKCFDLALERTEDGCVLGLISLVCKAHRKAEIGWALGVAHRGQGFATEAARALLAYGFTSLGLHRIQATTSSANPKSWGVMERLAMKKEARLREAECRDGQWLDILIYGMLATEWLENSGGWQGCGEAAGS
jgi:RimJ/RimL family protein N-acetyltransferase